MSKDLIKIAITKAPIKVLVLSKNILNFFFCHIKIATNATAYLSSSDNDKEIL